MASIRVRASDFSQGAFPETCARTGNLARSRYRLIAANSSASLAGVIPLSQDAVRRIRALRVLFAGFLAYGALGLLTGLVTGLAGFYIAGSGLLVGGVAGFGWLLSTFVAARLSGDEQWVTLSRVHPRFAQAVDAPPSKCAGCTGTSSCSLSDMAACEGAGHRTS